MKEFDFNLHINITSIMNACVLV